MLPDPNVIQELAADAARDRERLVARLTAIHAPPAEIERMRTWRSTFEEPVGGAALERAEQLLRNPRWVAGARDHRILELAADPGAEVFRGMQHIAASAARKADIPVHADIMMHADTRITLQADILEAVQAQLRERSPG